MSGDSRLADTQGPLLTAEEEVALLAEYGVEGPYDDLFDLPAVSNFHSALGDHNVFLTGAPDDDEVSQPSPHFAPETNLRDQLSEDELLRQPLDMLIMKHTPIFLSSASPNLTYNITAALDHIVPEKEYVKPRRASWQSPTTCFSENSHSSEQEIEAPAHNKSRKLYTSSAVDYPGVERYEEVLCSSKALEQHLRCLQLAESLEEGGDRTVPLRSNASPEDGTARGNDSSRSNSAGAGGGDFYSETIRASDEVLKRAAAVIRAPQHLDWAADDFFEQQRTRVKAEEEAFVNEAQDIFFSQVELQEQSEDAVVKASHAFIKKYKARACAATPKEKTALNEIVEGKTTMEPSSAVDSDAHRPTSASTAVFRRQEDSVHFLPALFAVEVQPSSEALARKHQWDQLIETWTERVEAQATSAVAKKSSSPNRDIKGRRNLLDGASQGGEAAQVNNFSCESPPQLLERVRAIALRDGTNIKVQSPDELEKGDRARERAVAEQLDALLASNRAQPGPTQSLEKWDRKGLLKLDGFATRVSALLPSLSQKVHSPDLNRHHDAARTASTDAASATPRKDVDDQDEEFSFEKLQREVRRAEFFIQREALEYRQMRQEEARVDRFIAAVKQRQQEIEAALMQCAVESQASHDAIVAEESKLHDALLQEAESHRRWTNQTVALRQVEATAELSRRVTAEHATGAVELQAAEDLNWAAGLSFFDLQLQEQEELHYLVFLSLNLRQRHLFWLEKQRQATEAFSNKEGTEPTSRHTVLQLDVRSCTTASSSQAALVPPLWSGTRLRALLYEEKRAASWSSDLDKKEAAVLKPLDEAVQSRCRKPDGLTALRRNRSTQPIVQQHALLLPQPAEESAPDEPKSAPADAASIENSPESEAKSQQLMCLNEALLRRLCALTFQNAERFPLHAAQYFHSVMLSLENIKTIDFGSLAGVKLQVAAPEGQSKARSDVRYTFVSPLIRELDLGSNSLSAVSLPDVLRTFTSLNKLALNDNSIASLSRSDSMQRTSSVRGVAAAQENALAEKTQLAELDVSSNRLTDIVSIGAYLSASLTHLTCFANRLESLAPLATCQHLEYLEASRNAIRSVEELGHLLLLQHVNLCDNQLTNIDALMAHHVLLEKLFVSKNPILALPCTRGRFMFLSQLFINDGKLTALTDDACAALPLLSVLHAESNNIRDITGLSCCPRLTAVKLSFNQLASVEDLVPLAPCKYVARFDISGNPLMRRTRTSESDATPAAQSTPLSHKSPRELINDVFSPDSIKRFVLLLMPQLRELNSEVITECDREAARRYTQSLAFATSAPSLDLLTQVRQAGMRSRGDGVFSHLLLLELLILGVDNPSAAYQQVFRALCSDACVSQIQLKLELEAVDRRRRCRTAELVEEQLMSQLRSRHLGGVPAVQRLSVLEQERGRTAKLQSMQDGLHCLKRCATPFAFSNVHVTSPGYALKARLHAESVARKTLSRWIYGRVLIRRATRDRIALRAARLEETNARREAAARRIQPRWRGAALRMRLHRLLHPAGEEDTGAYSKVQLEQLSQAPTEDDGIAAILRNAVRDWGPLPGFDVPSDAQVPWASGATSALSARRFVPSPPDKTTVKHSSESPQSPDMTMGRPHSTSSACEADGQSGDEPSRDRPATQHEEWSPVVALQIRKRQRKMEAVHKKYIREEFQRDPLKANKLKTSDNRKK